MRDEINKILDRFEEMIVPLSLEVSIGKYCFEAHNIGRQCNLFLSVGRKEELIAKGDDLEKIPERKFIEIDLTRYYSQLNWFNRSYMINY